MKNKIKIMILVIVSILLLGVILFGFYSNKEIKSICGNGIVEVGETIDSCCYDLDCPDSYFCEYNRCIYRKENRSIQKIDKVPAPPYPQVLSQPNNNSFQAQGYGDEHRNWVETLDGYTIIQNLSNGYWTYALKVNGTLVPSEHKVTIANPTKLNIPKHLAPNKIYYKNQ